MESSKLENKDCMIFCMMEFAGDEEQERGTEDWTNAVDKGGLWHINDMTYQLFYLIEKEVRLHLEPYTAHLLTEGTKEVLVISVM